MNLWPNCIKANPSKDGDAKSPVYRVASIDAPHDSGTARLGGIGSHSMQVRLRIAQLAARPYCFIAFNGFPDRPDLIEVQYRCALLAATGENHGSDTL
jgi:hypothetical protein